MNEIKWIKMSTSIFENRKIRQIESLPNGEAIIVIWLKLLCLAGNINDGGKIYFTKGIPYSEEMFATQFNQSVEIIKKSLETFENFEMISNEDDVLIIVNWEKYQNSDRLKDLREYNRIAKQKQRDKLKIADDEKPEVPEKEEKVNCQAVADLFNEICKSYPSVTTLSEARKKSIRARMKRFKMEDFEKVFRKAEASSFLKGSNNRDWSANFDWMMKDANIVKILDGNYDDDNSKKSVKPGFTKCQSRSYDFEELEKEVRSN